MVQSSRKPMKKKSSLDYGITENRRRCDCGISFLGEWAFEGEPKAFAGRLRRQAAVICTMYIFCTDVTLRHILVHEEALASRSGGTAIYSPRAYLLRGFLYFLPRFVSRNRYGLQIKQLKEKKNQARLSMARLKDGRRSRSGAPIDW